MIRLLKGPLVLALSALTSACVVEIGSSNNDDDILDYVFEASSKEEVLNPPSKYDFTLMGESNKITLKGNIGKILITGSYNYVIIEEDTSIEKLSITGLHNILAQEDDLSLYIETIELAGDNNFISINEYKELIDTGEDNQILGTETGLSF